MATSSLSTLYGRCFVIFMACIILIEGCLYLGMAIYGLAQENCSALTYSVEKPFQFTTDLLYFINEKCDSGNTNSITITLDDSTTAILPMDWAASYWITHRMFIFLIIYSVISAIWIFFSILIIFSLCSTITSCTVILFFWPWFISVIAGSLFDLVAAGFFISDITQTTTTNSALNYIGATTTNLNQAVLPKYDSYFVTPPIVMTCISLRLIIIWLLNVFGASFCISLVRAMISKPTPPPPKAQTGISPAAAAAVATPVPAQQAYVYPQSPMPMQEEYPTQIRPKPLPIQTPTQAAAAPAYYPDRRSYSPQTAQTPYGAYPTASGQTPSPATSPLTPPVMAVVAVEKAVVHTPATEVTTYRNTDTHPDRLDYPPVRTTMPESARMSAQPAQLSNDSVLNNRYSVDPVTVQNQHRVSDELRSQLPWSYTSMLIKPPPPPKPKAQVNIYPAIPEPDYVAKSPQTPQTPQDAYSRW